MFIVYLHNRWSLFQWYFGEIAQNQVGFKIKIYVSYESKAIVFKIKISIFVCKIKLK